MEIVSIYYTAFPAIRQGVERKSHSLHCGRIGIDGVLPCKPVFRLHTVLRIDGVAVFVRTRLDALADENGIEALRGDGSGLVIGDDVVEKGDAPCARALVMQFKVELLADVGGEVCNEGRHRAVAAAQLHIGEVDVGVLGVVVLGDPGAVRLEYLDDGIRTAHLEADEAAARKRELGRGELIRIRLRRVGRPAVEVIVPALIEGDFLPPEGGVGLDGIRAVHLPVARALLIRPAREVARLEAAVQNFVLA